MAKTDQDLGMEHPQADRIDVTIGGQTVELNQLPGVVQSGRSKGTTGAAVWRASVSMAEWLLSSQNPFACIEPMTSHLAERAVIELGCGVSPLLALSMRDKVKRFIATDQPYVLGSFDQNLKHNFRFSAKRSNDNGRKTAKSVETSRNNIETMSLDWEHHDIAKQLEVAVRSAPGRSSDSSREQLAMVVACDCVYNEDLIEPFVQACKTICGVQRRAGEGDAICLIGQQIRSPDVLELWMASMVQHFRLFRINSTYMAQGFLPASGFIAHIAVLKSLSAN